MSLIYFGSVPTSSQLVSKENLSRGINLCRQAPSSLNIIGLKEYTHPNYELYLQYFPKALESARTATMTTFTTKTCYYPYNGKNVPTYTRAPKLVWTYADKKPTDFLDNQKARFSAIETTAGGKPALSAILSVSQVRDLIKDTSPVETTNPSVNAMNLRGYIAYRKLHALAHAVLRCQQYALTGTSTKLTNERAVSMVALPNDILETPTGWTSHKVIKQNPSNMKFNMNLPTPYATCNHVISRAADIPNDEGLIFPYVESLSRDDFETVPSVLQGPLNGLFGSDHIENGAALNALLPAWRELAITEWGWELSHIYTGIRLALQTGAGIRTFVTPHGTYAGFILTGSLFSVFVDGKCIRPQPFNTLQADFQVATPHTAALTALFDKISFPSDIERGRDMALVTSMYDVGVLLRKYGYNTNDREGMARNAAKLTFPKDRYLPINGTNVARVFSVMHTGIGESEIPLHHLALFKVNRSHRLLSAFGVGCPSFMIEGGRKIPLTGDFAFKKNMKVAGGKRAEVKVNTMYAALKDLDSACDDLDMMLKEKHVLTFAGTPSAAKVSARAMVREFDGVHGTDVLAALRQLVGVSVLNTPDPSSSKKRKAEEADNEKMTKKAKAYMDDF